MVARISVTASRVTGMPSRNLPIKRFGGVGERLQTRQVEESAGSFDGVDEAEDVVEDLGVVGILLEADKLDIDHVDAFVRLRQEFPQQFVHDHAFNATQATLEQPFSDYRPLCWERVYF